MIDYVATVVLKHGRDKPIRNRHPWVFSGAIARVEGVCQNGDGVRVVDSHGEFLAGGYWNGKSQIRVRILTWDAVQALDEALLRVRLERSLEARQRLKLADTTNAYRLVYAEADGLPGLIVDRYADWLVVQCLTMGIARRREQLVDLLARIWQPHGIYARDDADVRQKEGLSLETGTVWGQEPPELIEIQEHGYQFLVDVRQGHKTGFYLDQRDSRCLVSAYCCGADVLNAFAYTGGFGVYAGLAGATSVVNVDSSLGSLELAEQNLARNGCADQELLLGDVFQVLRGYRDEGRLFDVIVLDPPKFATSQSQVKSAARGYKDINLWAMRLLRRGGTLVTFSCSGLVSTDLFQKIVFGASLDAGRDVQIVQTLAQGADHPVLLTFPESAYLKGLICRVW